MLHTKPPNCNDEMSFTGLVTSILSTAGSGCIFRLSDVVGANPVNVKVKASYEVISSEPALGEVWEVVGRIEQHQKYGEQVRASACIRQRPKGHMIIRFLSKNNRFTGIGDKTARQLWSVFADELYDVLDTGDVDRLIKKSKISRSRAILLCNAWATYSEETPIIQWLQKHIFPVSLSCKVLEFWGKDAAEELTKDPYRMLPLSNWVTVDRVAESIGIKGGDYLRIAAAIEATVYEYYNQGHTACWESDLVHGLNKKTDLNIKNISEIKFDLSDRIVEISNNLYQSVGAYAIETSIKKKIICRVSNPRIQQTPLFDYKKLRLFEENNKIQLHVDQIMAIKMALQHRISCITGGAGSGKTTVLKSIYHQIGESNDIFQIALTGRAAKQLMDTTGHDAKTIASFLLFAADHKLSNNCFLFIDESSMVDAPSLYRLLKIVPSSASICLLGDPNQLPPIGPGLPFHKLVDAKITEIPICHLTVAHRFDRGSGILELANSVRNQTNDFVLDEFVSIDKKSTGVCFVDCFCDSDLYDEALPIYRGFIETADAQLIAPMNDICMEFNKRLHVENCEIRKFKNELVPKLVSKNRVFTIGDKIVFRDRNDYSRNLFNGSLGILIEIFDTPKYEIDEYGAELQTIAVANFDNGNIVRLSYLDLDNISLGYCITVHKAQGSQFDRVVFICPNMKTNSIIDNSLIYTAVTRARRQLAIVGCRSTFSREISSHPRAFTRTVGLVY